MCTKEGYDLKNKGIKRLGKVLASLGIPTFAIGFIATAISSTTFSIIVAMFGIAFSGLAFIFLSDILER